MKYRVEERVNTFRESGKEYAILIMLDKDWWTLCAYEEHPDPEEIENVLDLFDRAYSILEPTIKKQILRALDSIETRGEKAE